MRQMPKTDMTAEKMDTHAQNLSLSLNRERRGDLKSFKDFICRGAKKKYYDAIVRDIRLENGLYASDLQIEIFILEDLNALSRQSPYTMPGVVHLQLSIVYPISLISYVILHMDMLGTIFTNANNFDSALDARLAHLLKYPSFPGFRGHVDRIESLNSRRRREDEKLEVSLEEEDVRRTVKYESPQLWKLAGFPWSFDRIDAIQATQQKLTFTEEGQDNRETAGDQAPGPPDVNESTGCKEHGSDDAPVYAFLPNNQDTSNDDSSI
ncbi:hypothetical protein ACLMJK_003775 [Lecanora helva]